MELAAFLQHYSQHDREAWNGQHPSIVVPAARACPPLLLSPQRVMGGHAVATTRTKHGYPRSVAGDRPGGFVYRHRSPPPILFRLALNRRATYVKTESSAYTISFHPMTIAAATKIENTISSLMVIDVETSGHVHSSAHNNRSPASHGIAPTSRTGQGLLVQRWCYGGSALPKIPH
jgi:hypothetical protein